MEIIYDLCINTGKPPRFLTKPHMTFLMVPEIQLWVLFLPSSYVFLSSKGFQICKYEICTITSMKSFMKNGNQLRWYDFDNRRTCITYSSFGCHFVYFLRNKNCERFRMRSCINSALACLVGHVFAQTLTEKSYNTTIFDLKRLHVRIFHLFLKTWFRNPVLWSFSY